jgi:hypothetical protein
MVTRRRGEAKNPEGVCVLLSRGDFIPRRRDGREVKQKPSPQRSSGRGCSAKLERVREVAWRGREGTASLLRSSQRYREVESVISGFFRGFSVSTVFLWLGMRQKEEIASPPTVARNDRRSRGFVREEI